MEVKEWKPAEGCKPCKQAAKLFDQHARTAAQTHALAVKRIRDLEAEVARLNRQQADFEYNASQIIEAAEAKLQVLTENRDYWMESCQAAQRQRDGANAQMKEFEAKLRAVKELPRHQAEMLGAFVLTEVIRADELDILLKEEENNE